MCGTARGANHLSTCRQILCWPERAPQILVRPERNFHILGRPERSLYSTMLGINLGKAYWIETYRVRSEAYQIEAYRVRPEAYRTEAYRVLGSLLLFSKLSAKA
jgi:hypothetical protein